MGHCWAGGLLPFAFSSLLAGLLLLLPLFADRSVPRISLGRIRCGGSGSGAAGGRACVRAKVCVCGARRVLGERPQRLGRDANATSRPHRGVDAHGEAVARAWRGCAQSGLAARVRTHARGSWCPRAAAWPCHARGTSIPGPQHDAAAERRQRLRGLRRRDRSLHEKMERRPERNGRSYSQATEGSSATPAAGGYGKER
jgi:hypothetical protein